MSYLALARKTTQRKKNIELRNISLCVVLLTRKLVDAMYTGQPEKVCIFC